MKRAVPEALPVWRLYLVGALLVALLLLLTGRLLALQVLNTERGYEFLQGQGEARALRTADIPAYRGMITDRRGEPLAVSTPVISLWANPRRLLEHMDQLPDLARELGKPEAALRERVQRYANKQFMYLQRRMMPDKARAVLALNIPGVHGEREYRRFYPAGPVASHLVGITNVDDEGLSGMELAYNDWLRGVPGKKQIIKDERGGVVRDIGELQAARPGNDLRLSIDLRLQYAQHRELQRAVKISGAESASVVTLDSHTGEVLAMVNFPEYNPNSREGFAPGSTRNRAMTDVVEPGSTMKPLTLVAALESGRYTVDTVIDTTPGTVRVGRKLIRDPRDYGELTLARVVQKSSQVGTTRVMLDLGHEPVWGVFNRFGIGQAPGTAFPGESAGRLPNRAKWHVTEQVTLGYGYGLTVTPVQLARAYSVFANAGKLPALSLLALEPGQDADTSQVLDPKIARQVLQVLHGVTGDDGTGRRARVPGYEVGGKTGTVHKVAAGEYHEDRYVALFAGLAPINDPRIVSVVVMNEPKGEEYGGGSAAAPVFSAVAGSILPLLNIAPQPAAVLARSAAATADGGPV